ncbi:multidrug effflux MFS transporter [Telmatospirillum siberiense]|uniref:Bcr/CflA family efflux transporter n=1 Tax=Telmatospirillum siberiense TaxID=382514 RepID=A0A2N3Q0B1_9PROT|nr:multidrug effflux MFS transporter [Telmatospirillum siberiense]PKU26093.1 Bcr/CflA family drug resistance efflux transporter [Telmatospirillum siberiense]
MTMSEPAARPDVSSTRLTIVLGALTAFAPFSTDMYLASFSSIAESLHTGLGEVQFTLSVFFFGLALGQLFYGPLIDRFGRRIPLLAGIALYIVASLLIVVAPDITTFTVLRLLQALGGCTGMIISRAIVRDLFDERGSARILSSMMVVQGLGPIIAPICGGYLLTLVDWRGVFVFLVLFGVCCFLAVMRHIPETLPAGRRYRTSLPRLLIVFCELLSDRRFIVPTVAGGFGLATLFAFISGSPFVFMELHGASRQQYGWLFGLCAFCMVAAARLSGMLLRRFQPRAVLFAALAAETAFAIVLASLSRTPSLPVLMIPLCLCMATIPLIGATSTAVAMSACGNQAGSASSLVGVMQFGLASLASALVGLFHNGTAFPMTVVILGCSLGGFALLVVGRRGRPVL